MVKVTFNSSLGQKEPSKPATGEALIPADTDVEDGLQVHLRRSRLWCWCTCLGLGLMLAGVVVGGACLYKAYDLLQSDVQPPVTASPSPDYSYDYVFFCGVEYMDDYMVEEVDGEVIQLMEMEDVELEEEGVATRLHHIQESVRVLEEGVELIEVAPSSFSDSDPANIVHDFNQELTAYLDLTLKKCFVAPLNTSSVMQPSDFRELLVQAHSSLPQSHLVHEQMMVTERLDDLEELGEFIDRMCGGYDTYRVELRAAAAAALGIQKREALNCHKIRHFENTFVVETLICEP